MVPLPRTADYYTFISTIWNKVIDILRDDATLLNYQFKSIEIVGEDFIPEVEGMPAIKLIPDDDNIRQQQTNDREHIASFGLLVYEHKPDLGAQSLLDHMKLAGRVYDLIMDNRQLGDIEVKDSVINSVRPRFFGAEQGVNFVTLLQVQVKADKAE